MFRNFEIAAALALLRRLSIWVLALGLSVGSMGPTIAVQAAPLRQGLGETVLLLGVYMPDPPICAGQKYIIRVNLVRSSREYVNNSEHPMQNYVNKGLFGVTIEASIVDRSIGTFSPDKEKTGLNLLSGLTDEPGDATFAFYAKKAGTTNLIFEGLVPKTLLGSGETAYVSAPLKPITVQNCGYKVSMLYINKVPGFSVVGKLTTTLKAYELGYKGSGMMDAKSTVSAACGTTITDFKSQTTVGGTTTSDGKKLQLEFHYEPGTTTTSVSCGVNFSKTQDPTSALISSAEFPVGGGTRRFAAAGGGSLVITVTPIKGSK